MSMNIKSPEAHRLAREVAAATGETLTAAVTEALRERLERLHADDATTLAARLVDIGRRCAERLPESVRTLDHAELLYDDSGLPG